MGAAAVCTAAFARFCGCKDSNHATDDEDDRHATANNKRQVSLDKVSFTSSGGEWGYWTCRCLREALMVFINNRSNLAIAIHESKTAPMRIKLALGPGFASTRHAEDLSSSEYFPRGCCHHEKSSLRYASPKGKAIELMVFPFAIDNAGV
ncbi:MAG: hypothetical protein ACLTYW_05245 [Collinsella sp.]